MNRFILAALAFLLLGPALAGQTVIPNYDTARDQFFWKKLYPPWRLDALLCDPLRLR